MKDEFSGILRVLWDLVFVWLASRADNSGSKARSHTRLRPPDAFPVKRAIRGTGGSPKVTQASSLCLVLAICLSASTWAASPAQSVTIPPKDTPSPELIPQGKPPLDPDIAATVVVYNERDPISVDLAGQYAAKRGIPFDHLVNISCTTEETISRADYDKTIAEPLRKEFIHRGWWRMGANRDGVAVAASTIRFVALIRGVPLKIAPVSDYPGDKPGFGVAAVSPHNEAAVDSELAALGLFSQQISGALPNPYYRSFAPLADEPTPSLLLVCRLDAAYPRTVHFMIENSIEVEKTGLWGFAYVDSRNLTGNTGLAEGDRWLRRIREDALKHGIPCIFDDLPGVFPEHYPMRYAALYFGWYTEQVEGAFKDEKLRLVPGAVAIHIHSFSADSLRLPLRNWCAPLLERGAVATSGNVYEPYLAYTPNLDIFEERLRSGFTFAEASYASVPVISWMTTFIGDPLYRPFKRQQDVLADAPSGSAAEWAAYREGVRLWFSKDRVAGEAALKTKARVLKSGVILEGLGCLQEWAKDPEGAVKSWAMASQYYANEEDQVRCVLHAVELRRATGEIEKALGLARQQIRAHPQAGATQVLRAMEAELIAPPKPVK